MSRFIGFDCAGIAGVWTPDKYLTHRVHLATLLLSTTYPFYTQHPYNDQEISISIDYSESWR